MYDKIVPKLTYPGRILGRSRYFSSVVLVPFMFIDNEWHLVFQKRAENIRQGGEVSFPGGGFDPAFDASLADTAVRETVEELGIMPEDIHVDGHMGTIVAPMGVIVDVYVGRIILDSINSFNINSGEVEKIFTVPIREFNSEAYETYSVCLEISSSIRPGAADGPVFPAKELGIQERYHGGRGERFYDIYLYRTAEGIIWGLTAEIIKEMVELASE